VTSYISKETRQMLHSVSEKWRYDDAGLMTTGYVIVFNGEVDGWIVNLTDCRAAGFRTGAIAVPFNIHKSCFAAMGRDADGGGANWQECVV
jgi:hypothetical protein